MPDNEVLLENHPRIAGSEIASRLFDQMVDQALAGSDQFVTVMWPDDTGESEGPGSRPVSVINGRTAYEYAQALIEDETEDIEVLNEAAHQFNNMVACSWHTTMEYYKDLEQLGEDIRVLALPGSPFYDRAEAVIKAHGPEVIGKKTAEEIAFEIACTDLKDFEAAVEKVEEQGQTMAHHIFDRLVYYQLVGSVSKIEISRHEATETTPPTVNVLIGKKTAYEFAHQALSYLLKDEEAVDVGCYEFVKLMCTKWEETLDYYEGLGQELSEWDTAVKEG